MKLPPPHVVPRRRDRYRFLVGNSFQRARQPEEKDQRRMHLLSTARSLLDADVSLRLLSLNEIARRAGMAKANVYTYFESREALLLSLLADEWHQWFQRFLGEKLAAPGRTRRPEGLREVMALLAQSLAQSRLLCELTAALPTVLEQNLQEETIRSFKYEALALFAKVAKHLVTLSPALSQMAYAELMHDAVHAIMGLFPATHPSPAAARALMDPNLRFFRREFVDELTRVLGALAADHLDRVSSPRRSLPDPSEDAPRKRHRTAMPRDTREKKIPRFPSQKETEAYVRKCSEPARARLRHLCRLIRAQAPDAAERLSYGLPTWYQGENLIHLGAFRHHIGVYPGREALEAFAQELSAFKTTKGSIRIPHDVPLPTDLIGRIAQWRVQQAESRATRQTPRSAPQAKARARPKGRPTRATSKSDGAHRGHPAKTREPG
jgi:uncharacterized protein YdhG (YjbR/CyaY superfamily)/AcrR family transcriptional regulator